MKKMKLIIGIAITFSMMTGCCQDHIRKISELDRQITSQNRLIAEQSQEIATQKKHLSANEEEMKQISALSLITMAAYEAEIANLKAEFRGVIQRCGR
ncbi:MAG: hypothetical protein HC887_07985 [Desulfobacteraceae bacterium]|nr:hypothetical protein [Desulfobacteraceae bacterium]